MFSKCFCFFDDNVDLTLFVLLSGDHFCIISQQTIRIEEHFFIFLEDVDWLCRSEIKFSFDVLFNAQNFSVGREFDLEWLQIECDICFNARSRIWKERLELYAH